MSDTSETKICYKCTLEKPITEFHTSGNKRKNQCKSCSKKTNAASRTVKGIRGSLLKLCWSCQVVQPVDEFRKSTQAKDGYSSNCKRCLMPDPEIPHPVVTTFLFRGTIFRHKLDKAEKRFREEATDQIKRESMAEGSRNPDWSLVSDSKVWDMASERREAERLRNPSTYVEPTHQVCEVCEKDKPISDFYRGAPLASFPKGKPLKWCSSCHTDKDKLYRGSRTKEEQREVQARRKKYKTAHKLSEFGLLPEDVPDECEICGGESSNVFGRLAIDHDHKTGLFRGFLCNNCNLALGNAKDNPKILRSMVKYLVNHARKTEAA